MQLGSFEGGKRCVELLSDVAGRGERGGVEGREDSGFVLNDMGFSFESVMAAAAVVVVLAVVLGKGEEGEVKFAIPPPLILPPLIPPLVIPPPLPTPPPAVPRLELY